MTAGVYRIRCKPNDTYYVGETTNLEKRFKYEHLRALRTGRHHNAHLQHAWTLYGEKAFDVEILITVPLECEEILDRERLSQITKRLEAQIGYAMVDAGMKMFNMRDFCHWDVASPMVSLTIRERAAKSLRSPEVRKKMSVAVKRARQDPEKGPAITMACQSPEARARRSESLRKAWSAGLFENSAARGEAARRKNSESARARWQDPDFRARMVLARSGENSPVARKVKCVETGEMFVSLTAASAATGAEKSNIARSITRKIKAGGFTWAYA